jgi:hypothetical protein
MNSFKKILVIGDRMTGKTQFVNSNKNEDAFVIDDVPIELVYKQMGEYFSDKYSQSIVVLQRLPDMPELTDQIDCMVLFQMNKHTLNALLEIYAIPNLIIEKISSLNKYEYIVWNSYSDEFILHHNNEVI